MVKMVSLKKTAADRAAEKKAMGEASNITGPDQNEGVMVHLDHNHLTKMGLHGDLKSGDGIEFHGKGEVERSETRSTPDGDRHSASLRIHKAGYERDVKSGGDEEKRSVRGDLEKAYSGVEDKSLPDKGGKGKAE